jgi:putative FmdB family regulatory protein
MPIYEYECRKCKAHIEVFQKMSDKPALKCRKCGGRLDKMFSASAIQFKGSGWYVTDYADRGKKAAAKADSETGPSDDKKSDKTDKTDKPEKKAKDISPVKKTSEKTSSTKASNGD